LAVTPAIGCCALSVNRSTNLPRVIACKLRWRHLGMRWLLGVEIGRVTDSPAKRLAYAQAEKQLHAENLIFNDPFVQSMMRDFGAKIVPGSIKPAA
jgi:hypothetical protein